MANNYAMVVDAGFSRHTYCIHPILVICSGKRDPGSRQWLEGEGSSQKVTFHLERTTVPVLTLSNDFSLEYGASATVR